VVERDVPNSGPIKELEGGLDARGWRDGAEAARFANKSKLRASVGVPGRKGKEEGGTRRRRWKREGGRL